MNMKHGSNTKKADEHYALRKENLLKKSMNARVRRVALIRFQRVQTEFFFVRDSRAVTLNLNLL